MYRRANQWPFMMILPILLIMVFAGVKEEILKYTLLGWIVSFMIYYRYQDYKQESGRISLRLVHNLTANSIFLLLLLTNTIPVTVRLILIGLLVVDYLVFCGRDGENSGGDRVK